MRLLTLVGPGGTGKTRLAVEAADRLRTRLPHGVVFVDLSPLTDPARVARSIVEALGAREVEGVPLPETLRGALSGREVLLVLDNCEHVLAGLAVVSDLLGACPAARVLATSREPLRLRWERTFAVPPLAYPDLQAVPDLATLGEIPAVALFVERAQAIQPSFALAADNAMAVAEVCARLDGLPLAIELAAARANALPVRAIAARLGQRLELLRSGARDQPARHQTMAAAIAWSYDLLEPAEQALFRRMSVFTGGWTVEAAEAICGPDPVAQDVLEGIASLASKSLLHVTEQADGEPRYQMLETVQLYARQALRRTGEDACVARRHAWFCLELVEQAEGALRGSDQERWLDRLGRDHDNLRAALAWAFEMGEVDVGLRLPAALAAYWSVRGPFTEGREWLEQAFAVGTSAPAALRARLASGLGTMHWCLSAYQQATIWHETALGLYGEASDTSGVAFSLYNLGVQAFHLGQLERAQALFVRSQTHYQAAGDRWGLASTLLAGGVLAVEQGDDARAARLCEESLGHYRAVGDRRLAGVALNNLGEVARRQADYRRAAAMYEQALTLARSLNDLPSAAMTLHNMGQVALARGRLPEAGVRFGEALQLARGLQEKRIVMLSLAGLAAVAVGRGQLARAGRLIGSVERLVEELGVALEASDRLVYERTRAAVRAGLGTAAADAERATGRTLVLEQALEAALSAPAGADVPTARNDVASTDDPLSPREREVALLVAQGCTNRLIAEALVISQRTANTHVQHILDKLGFNSRAQVAAWAARRTLATT